MIPLNKKTEQEVANDKAEKIMNGVATWCSFYRSNPHRFARDYLGVSLKLFQAILLCMMNTSNYFMYLAARGQGKTWLIALFCVIRSILFPGTKICVASKNRNQANEVLEKITTDFMEKSDNLKLEIEDYSVGQNKAFILFKNGSWIKVVTASDSGRSARANILITDEFRMVDLNVINTVLRKFLTAPRTPKYLNKKEYKHLVERNKEIYMSSCWFKSHWSFEKAKAYCANLVSDAKKYFICGLPYQISIKEGLLSKEQVADEMSESDFSEMAWDMEMGCLWYGDKDGSLFSYEDTSKNRILKRSVYPSNVSKLLSDKTTKIPDLKPQEQRIISADVALLASKKQNNDAASIFINSAIPTGSQKYIGNMIYTENHEGLNTDELALIIRRYYEMFKCTYIALDVKGIGLGVYDCLIKDMYDPLTGETYVALSCCNDKVYADRCKVPGAPKVIWAIQATAQFNNDMYLSLREGFRQNKINLLINEFEAEEVLKEIRGYGSLSSSDKMQLQLPYIHTTLLINELINLEYEAKGVNIKVHEKSGMRKDRVSSVGYNYWVQCQLEMKLRAPKNTSFDPSQGIIMRQPRLRKY
ncbi:hypothetical protein [Clostridium sp. HBUAS56010]|uniref:hypothetical protein n=1 Tax=Clostridium sp. HBUAS56010 TaxID=2571127 RepID=UPI0011789BAF|nr:hypothetical protein [Clostridium sp. HBUAS56010]